MKLVLTFVNWIGLLWRGVSDILLSNVVVVVDEVLVLDYLLRARSFWYGILALFGASNKGRHFLLF